MARETSTLMICETTRRGQRSRKLSCELGEWLTVFGVWGYTLTEGCLLRLNAQRVLGSVMGDTSPSQNGDS